VIFRAAIKFQEQSYLNSTECRTRGGTTAHVVGHPFNFVIALPHSSFSISHAVLIGVGSFAVSGLALYGIHLVYQRYRHRRNLQLIEESDALFSTLTPLTL